MAKKVILASSSPRRRELLTRMGVTFTILTRPTDEHTSAEPRDAVKILAQRKALAVAADLSEGLVLGADTLVSLDTHPLGKPANREDAIHMLRKLSGRTHQVYTGVCLVDAASKELLCDVDCTDVCFRTLSEDEICRYVDSGEPMDKAGAYAIQGGAGAFVESINGSFENVMGLPVQMLEGMLRQMGGL